MSTSELPEGWTDTNYKSFKTVDNSSESSLSDEEDSDEYGAPRESAIKIIVSKISNQIINELTSTW